MLIVDNLTTNVITHYFNFTFDLGTENNVNIGFVYKKNKRC